MYERRVYRRVNLKNGCIVAHAKRVGNIRNISKGGLFCTCFQENPCKKAIKKIIDILCCNGNLVIKDVKVRVVGTERITGKFLRNFEMKKCRMQFDDLEEDQSACIEGIIAEHLEDENLQKGFPVHK